MGQCYSARYSWYIFNFETVSHAMNTITQFALLLRCWQWNIFLSFLFLAFLGFIPGPKSYFLDFPNVFVTACGTNFYSQCLPSQTVNLGFTSTAMHWLHDKPRDVPGVFNHILVEEPETAEKLKRQAAKDWELLLLQRAKEMAPGEMQL